MEPKRRFPLTARVIAVGVIGGALLWAFICGLAFMACNAMKGPM